MSIFHAFVVHSFFRWFLSNRFVSSLLRAGDWSELAIHVLCNYIVLLSIVTRTIRLLKAS